jgi:GDPmannose 4,6-dehydratase
MRVKPDENRRFCQAGSSEMFGASPPPQNETTPFNPRSPYAVSKVAAHWFSINQRRHTISSFVMEFSSITNLDDGAKHSSRARSRAHLARSFSVGRRNSTSETLKSGEVGVTRLITSARCGFTLQQDSPGDCVVATGESHSVREFLDLAASFAGINRKSCIETDPRCFRPTEVDFLQRDASRQTLGWRPEVRVEELVRSMVDRDLELARQEQTLLQAGQHIKPRGRLHG